MKKLFVIALSLFVLCALVAAPAAAEDAKKEEVKQEEAKKPAIPAGQKVFTEAKCTMCHTVFSAGIGEMPETDEEKEKALDGPPDLSMTGKGRTAEWMTLFLQKEETLNDKKHGMKFMGKDEDLGTLVEWLMTLKPAEEKVEKVEKKIEKVEKKAEEKVEKAEEKIEKTEEKAEEKVEKAVGTHAGHGHDDHHEKADDDHDDHEEAHEEHDDHDDHDEEDDEKGE
jgi:mono/diheme cytochrome c family protein